MTAERVAGFTALFSGGLLALVLAITAAAAPDAFSGMTMGTAMPMSGCAAMQMNGMMSGGMGMSGAACGGAGASASPAPSATAIPGATEVRVTAANFSLTPSEIYLPKGSSVNITLVNTSDQSHDLTAPGLGLHVVAGPGETRTTSLSNLAAGRYDAYCSVPGHAQLGMRATIIVD